MSESYIGQWLARHRRGSKRHLVESEITDRLVMKCGKQMRLVIGDWGLHPFADHDFCKVCDPDADYYVEPPTEALWKGLPATRSVG